jgi:hypothetical protein
MAAKLHRRHPHSAEAAAVHADTMALDALDLDGGPDREAGLDAAAGLYFDAIRLTTPSGDPELRQRLESNLAYVSLAMARPLHACRRRLALQDRAEARLRNAAALGQSAEVLAVLTQHHVMTGAGTPPAYSQVAGLPWGVERARLACLVGATHGERGNRDEAQRFFALKDAVSSEEPSRHAMSGEGAFDFEVLLDANGLRPLASFHSRLYLVPTCAGFTGVQVVRGRLRSLDDEDGAASPVVAAEVRAVRAGERPGGFVQHLRDAYQPPPQSPRTPPSNFPGQRSPF